jgi:hypothetical protein
VLDWCNECELEWKCERVKNERECENSRDRDLPEVDERVVWVT